MYKLYEIVVFLVSLAIFRCCFCNKAMKVQPFDPQYLYCALWHGMLSWYIYIRVYLVMCSLQ